ncbi:DUF418 domain-containing protein [Halalkalibacterium halodurans]|jgi:uncharacterized protein|uniref:DUF418 domain-containing protein n=1 Tax=Halalkalibacterium halodurans TaxID=86665 RepID=UPI002E211A30|nr:DUF418 domain-containing protein [Halalkalibacterium halodurans]
MLNGQSRIRLLDILRGFAILGTLGTNIWLFAYLGDLSYVLTYDHSRWWASSDDFIRLLVLFLVNGKFLGLLTIMFGVGLELKYRQALRHGSPWPGMYIWISLILLLEGLLHFTLVMEYDILMSYALTAIIVSFIVKRGDQAIKRALKWVGGFHLLLVSLILLVSVLIYLSGGTLALGSMEHTIALYQHGSWLEQLLYRINHFWILRSEAIFVLPMNVFLFLSGVLLMRAGAFSPDQHGKRIRRKLLAVGMYVGIPLNLLIFVPGGIFDLPVRYLFAPILSLGYMALIAFIFEKSKHLWIWGRLEDIGRMALSCYVLQNIIASIIFYGWGFNLGGSVNSLTVVTIWLLISVLLASFATVWHHFFTLGPMEIARKYLAGLPRRSIKHVSKDLS